VPYQFPENSAGGTIFENLSTAVPADPDEEGEFALGVATRGECAGSVDATGTDRAVEEQAVFGVGASDAVADVGHGGISC
jgi:hypothetical protein